MTLTQLIEDLAHFLSCFIEALLTIALLALAVAAFTVPVVIGVLFIMRMLSI